MAYKDLHKKRESELRWYYKNKEKIQKYKIQARKDRLLFIQKLKDVACKDCGIKYPSFVMDFDHYKGQSKLGNINTLAGTRYGWKTLEEEINKCDIVCANCHRIRTYKRTHL